MNIYRNVIGIKIKIAGEQIGNKRATALELSTEVNIRNWKRNIIKKALL